jgi:hypothetical protein
MTLLFEKKWERAGSTLSLLLISGCLAPPSAFESVEPQSLNPKEIVTDMSGDVSARPSPEPSGSPRPPNEEEPPKPADPRKPQDPKDIVENSRCDDRKSELPESKVWVCHRNGKNLCEALTGAIQGHDVPMDGSISPKTGARLGRCEEPNVDDGLDP